MNVCSGIKSVYYVQIIYNDTNKKVQPELKS